MELGHGSSATQNVIERGTFETMSLRKCALIAFPFDRGSQNDNKIIAFKN